MKITYSTIAFLLVLICSCKNQNKTKINSNNNINKIIIDFSDKAPLDYSNLIYDKKFIPLETNPEYLIGNIDKVSFFKDKILILDESSSKALFVFNNKGKILFKISNIGKGPGEFLAPNDFGIDTLNQHILITDTWQRKELRYDFTGAFIKETKLNFNFSGTFAYIPPGIALYDIDGAYNPNNNNLSQKKLLIRNDIENKISSHFTSRKASEKFINSPFKFYSSREGIIYIPKLSDTLYLITQNEIKPHYFIDFGENKVKKNFEESEIKSIYESCAFGIREYIETDSHIFFVFTRWPNVNYVFYSKKNKRVIHYTEIKRNSESLGLNSPRTTNDNEFVFVIEPYVLKRQIEAYKKNKHETPQLPPILSSLKSSDNPVLMLCKIKEWK